jgi:hypothetical protein
MSQRRSGRIVSSVLVLLAACASACATPESETVDIPSLAREYQVEPEPLRLYLRGYDEGYEDGDNRNAGVFAGSGLGNVPGPEGWGWRQGLEDGVNGVPRRSPEELAPILRDR